jgi:hypothetical protein
MAKKIKQNLHGYGPPPKERQPPPSIPGVEIFYTPCPLPLDFNAGFNLLRLNGGYAVKQYPDLKPGEINFILR